MTDDQGAGASRAPHDADTQVEEPTTQPTSEPPVEAAEDPPTRPVREWSATPPAGTAATAATTGAGAAPGTAPPPAEQAAAHAAHTTVLPGERRPQRPGAPRERVGGPAPRPAARPGGRGRRARLVLQRVDPWSVFLFSLVASLCLGVVLLVAVAALYLSLDVLGVLSSVNGVLGEVVGGEAVFTAGRVLGLTAVLAAVDVVILTALATLSALLYNLCASLTGGVEVVLGERE